MKKAEILSFCSKKCAKVRSHIALPKTSRTHTHCTHSSKSLSARTSARTSHVRKCDFTHMCAATNVKVIERRNVGWPVAWTRSATQFINWFSFVTKLMFNYCHITEVIIHYLNELLKNFIIVRWFFRSFFTYFHFLQILVRPKVLPVWHLVAALY